MQTNPAPQAQRIGVPREVYPGENVCHCARRGGKTRPDSAFKWPWKRVPTMPPVSVTTASGRRCRVVADAATLWASSDIVLKVRPQQRRSGADAPRRHADWLHLAAQNPALMEQLQAKRATVLAIDCPAALSRAQKMDALTSTAGVSGYRAVIEAANANAFGRYSTAKSRPAGKVPPARCSLLALAWPVSPQRSGLTRQPGRARQRHATEVADQVNAGAASSSGGL